MISFDEFSEEFTDIQRDVLRDHGGSKLCLVLHRDLGLNETRADDADELVERWKEATGQDTEPDGIDLTNEHAHLHVFLSNVKMTAVARGIPADELLAAMFIIGRRYGLREAAKMFGSLGDSLEASA